MLQRKRKSVQRKVKEGHSKLNLTRKRKLKKGKERMTTTKLVQEAQEKQKKKIITGRPKANGLPRSPAMTYPIEAGPTQVVTKGRLNNHFNLKTHSPAIVGQSVYVSEMPSAVSVTDMALAPTESLQAQEMRPDLSNVGKIGMANIHHSSSAHSVGINLFWISFLTVWMTLYLRQK
ncbi:hypothetical protein BY458DRAFT_526688 [Sporodiniella umbellata]|nr:hypothetical protein BY458DRAFT_526688 [Sporodiniella umbellata]